MQLRSLIRVRLTKYFPSDIYVKNRSSRADGILVDIELTSEEDQYKLESLKRLNDSSLVLPSIHVDPFGSTQNQQLDTYLQSSKIEGIALRSAEETNKEDFDGINTSIPYTDTVHTLLWNLKQKMITHSIIAYHMINENDILWDSRLQTAVRESLKKDIQPLAARSFVMQDMNSAMYEFNLLKSIGFTGVVIRNPNLIDLSNKIFS